jgi:Sulfotransferase domain
VKIVVTEHPKSGGTWVVSMLGDALSLPKRDIYVRDGFDWFDVRAHPWYAGATALGLTDSCVIKSHELPDSPLTPFPARFLHLVRDGRDVMVSKYFYDKDFCVANGLSASFDVPLDEYVPKVAAEWRDYVRAWLDHGTSLCRYEDFLADPGGTLRGLLADSAPPVTERAIEHAVEVNSRENLRRALDRTFRHNTFVRRGVAGDWREHLDQGQRNAFKDVAGDLLVRLGYERDSAW